MDLPLRSAIEAGGVSPDLVTATSAPRTCGTEKSIEPERSGIRATIGITSISPLARAATSSFHESFSTMRALRPAAFATMAMRSCE